MNYKKQQEFLETKLLSHRAKKSQDAIRWIEDSEDVFRTEYQRDIGRILYSDAFRRLSHKTQVFLAREMDQHSRTRMTHTLEVSQIAKSISRPLDLNIDLTEAIALGHDLGHTPFGHAGEFILNNRLNEIGKTFNHNVQSVWILQKSTLGRKNKDGKMYPGFNLTYDVIEGVWKHTKVNNQVQEFEESLSRLDENSLGSLEAQVVNKADSIAYIFHDIKDAVRNRIITLDEFENDVWKKHFDIEFDQEKWINEFIFDLIQNNISGDSIEFSRDIEKAYKGTRDYLYNQVIKSEKIQSSDEECKEKINVIYDYYKENLELLINRNGNANQYKLEKYGEERVIVDYIQWLGDANANFEYDKIIKAKSNK